MFDSLGIAAWDKLFFNRFCNIGCASASWNDGAASTLRSRCLHAWNLRWMMEVPPRSYLIGVIFYNETMRDFHTVYHHDVKYLYCKYNYKNCQKFYLVFHNRYNLKANHQNSSLGWFWPHLCEFHSLRGLPWMWLQCIEYSLYTFPYIPAKWQ